MLRTNKDEATACLQEAIANLPSAADARSEFFLNWRSRTAAALEVLFYDDPEVARQFKQVEFSPRRLTKDDVRDSQLRLDAYLAGCAAAKTLLEELLQRIAESTHDQNEAKKSTIARETVSRTAPAEAVADVEPAPAKIPAPTPDISRQEEVARRNSEDDSIQRAHVTSAASNSDRLKSGESSRADGDGEDSKADEPKRAKLRQPAADDEDSKTDEPKRARLRHPAADDDDLKTDEPKRGKLRNPSADDEDSITDEPRRAGSRRAAEERESSKADEPKRERSRRAEADREVLKAEEPDHEEARPEVEARRSKPDRDSSVRARPNHEPPTPVRSAAVETNQMCGPVRSSLSRVLGAWERGDADTAAVLSAQLLAELTLLSRQEGFKTAFQNVVARAFPPQAAPAVDFVTASAPLCVWSVFSAINEIMKS